MRTLADDEAAAVVHSHAEEVLALAGWAGFAAAASECAPCRGPEGPPATDASYASGSFQLLVPIEQQRPLVERVARGWAERGYTVTPVTGFPDGGAKATARTGDQFVDLTLGSGQPPAMVLVIVTACYRPR
jgi:hypothetical protein